MASITAIGGPNRSKRLPFDVLRDAVADDMRESTAETRTRVIAARADYLAQQVLIAERVRFDLDLTRRMKVLTAPPVEEPVRRTGVSRYWAVVVVALLVLPAVGAVLLAWLVR